MGDHCACPHLWLCRKKARRPGWLGTDIGETQGQECRNNPPWGSGSCYSKSFSPILHSSLGFLPVIPPSSLSFLSPSPSWSLPVSPSLPFSFVILAILWGAFFLLSEERRSVCLCVSSLDSFLHSFLPNFLISMFGQVFWSLLLPRSLLLYMRVSRVLLNPGLLAHSHSLPPYL